MLKKELMHGLEEMNNLSYYYLDMEVYEKKNNGGGGEEYLT